MWKSFVEPDRQLFTTWSMGIACWIPEATHAQNVYTYCFSSGCANASPCYVMSCIILSYISVVTTPGSALFISGNSPTRS